MQIQIICSRVTGILILIGSFECLKEVKTMDMILGKCKFPNIFLPYFQVHIEIASMRQFQCTPTTYVFSISEFFTISFLKTNSQLQRNKHVEMNNFSCSLSCTQACNWMTIIDCLIYACDSLS